MQRYILNEETKTFYESDIHHITKVMRMKSGEEVITCLSGICSLVKLNINNSNNVEFEIVNQLEQNPIVDITLVQGLLKGTKIDTTIKYATIFGAKKIILTQFERSITKVKNSDTKIDRYFNIAKEAAELSHREIIPVIEMSSSLRQINWDLFDYIILADEEEHLLNLKEIVDEKLLKSKIAVIVGPEGGIANNERKFLKSLNCVTVSLGKYIFPAEIASLSILNEIKY